MVTLQVKMLLFFVLEISAQGVSKNMVGNCVLIFHGFLPALHFHCSVTVCGVLVLHDLDKGQRLTAPAGNKGTKFREQRHTKKNKRPLHFVEVHHEIPAK